MRAQDQAKYQNEGVMKHFTQSSGVEKSKKQKYGIFMGKLAFQTLYW